MRTNNHMVFIGEDEESDGHEATVNNNSDYEEGPYVAVLSDYKSCTFRIGRVHASQENTNCFEVGLTIQWLQKRGDIFDGFCSLAFVTNRSKETHAMDRDSISWQGRH